MAETIKDWDPGAYDAFRGLRLRPALDLLANVGTVPDGDLVDLGCGTGAVGLALRHAYPSAQLQGIDASPAMLAKAEHACVYNKLIQTDIATWTPETAPALIFSNAALQWLPRHDALFPKLASYLRPGGMLAVQMPGQNLAPSHAAYRFLTGRQEAGPGIAPVEEYTDWLSPYGKVRIWETSYYQHLPPWEEGHPVRAFTRTTYGRPFLADMSPDALRDFEAAYDAEMILAYPLRPDGSVFFPFRRVFVLFQRSD